MSRQLILVRHGDDPPDDRVVSFAIENGFQPVFCRPFRGEALPILTPEIAGSVIYGGPFSVFEEDRHPFLHTEADWIRACMAANVPLLGICQGAQQIARVLGAEVGPHAEGLHEFGYYPITPTAAGRDFLPETIAMTQSHYHGFAIPQGAVHLASSALYPNQAFRHSDRTYALQFHPECTIEGFRRWQSRPWAKFGMPGAQSRQEQEAMMLQADAEQASWFYRFLARLFGTVPPKDQSASPAT